MSSNPGSSFGAFNKAVDFSFKKLTPIQTEFSRGSVPGSIYTSNRESAWSRWRRGYEIASASVDDNDFHYPFSYVIPVASGTPGSANNPQPTVSGTFVGFPTSNKELGMHWAGWRYAGSLRCDKLTDPVSTQKLFIETVTEDKDFWYVKLAGTWSAVNSLPPPFYVKIGGAPVGITPITTEIMEDRIITLNGEIINKDTINPLTQKRYGYVQAVLVQTNAFTGILKFKKAGSVYVSPDQELLTPSPVGFTPGRYLITGARFCCSCQDFTHRDYMFTQQIGDKETRIFPRANIAAVKPGRYELTRLSGVIDNSAMTSAKVNRRMTVYSPSGYSVPFAQGGSVLDGNATRGVPGVYRDFGGTYLRNTTPSGSAGIPGALSERMPTYGDYASANGNITSLTDNWTPLLDEMRYCKHIYAMKFMDKNFPPEPSDFPVEVGSMIEWERKLVEESEKDIQSNAAFLSTKRALSNMDVPPYNCQSPMMMPMMQKLFNIPSLLVLMENFTMYDKNGTPYVPTQDGRPSTD